MKKSSDLTFHRSEKGSAVLLPGSPFFQRCETDAQYLNELDAEQLLTNYYNEAGIGTEMYAFHAVKRYGGWEYPACHQRGHFLGHWMSAVSHYLSVKHNPILSGKLDYVLERLELCQKENGGEWIFAIPPKYLDWARTGKQVWAPQYNIHKTLMGLMDAWQYAGRQKALDLFLKAARFFYRYMKDLSDADRRKLLDAETGGMLEVWAQAYAAAGEPWLLELAQMYRHLRLEEDILTMDDPLLNHHANTTIPEMHGYCRMYEVTGDPVYRQISDLYWKSAVDDRNQLINGSSNLSEVWIPKDAGFRRVGHSNSELCTNYNMIRLAAYLYDRDNDPKYQEYIEKLLWNGILPQAFWEGYLKPTGIQTEAHMTQTGVTYYMPLIQGGKKDWSTKFDSFWCCLGTGIQACVSFQELIFSVSRDAVRINQYISSEYHSPEGGLLTLKKFEDNTLNRNPGAWTFRFTQNGMKKKILLREPSWSSKTVLRINGKEIVPVRENGYLVTKPDEGETAEITFGLSLRAVPLSDTTDMYGFMNGPVVLAALTDHSQTFRRKSSDPSSFLHTVSEFEFGGRWQSKFAARAENGVMIEFLPLYDISFQAYTVYHFVD